MDGIIDNKGFKLKLCLNKLMKENEELKKRNDNLTVEINELKNQVIKLYEFLTSNGYENDEFNVWFINEKINRYIHDNTIEVDELPLYGNEMLIYQLPNKLQYIYFKKKWECIGELED